MSTVQVKRKRGRPSKADIAARVKAAKKTNETPAERVKRIAERFTVMYKLTQGTIAGNVRSLIVSGAPGVGKSFTIEHLLDQAGGPNSMRPVIRYRSVKGASVTGIHLFKLLYEMREPNCILLMDDSDSIYDDEVSISLLKAALDTTAVRKLTWLSEAPMLKAENIPSEFVYEGSVIFITNKDFQSIIDFKMSKIIPHLAALMSRSIYLDLKLHDEDDLIAWISHMVLRNHILVQRGLDHPQEAAAMKWIQDHHTQVRELSIRTALKVADFIKTDSSNWEMFARVTLLR